MVVGRAVLLWLCLCVDVVVFASGGGVCVDLAGKVALGRSVPGHLLVVQSLCILHLL